MTGYVRQARVEDLGQLAENLRAADVAEIYASNGLDPEAALLAGFASGETRVVCLPSGLPVAIFGAVPLHVDPTVGVVWMVATTRFQELHGQFMRECKPHLETLCAPFKLVFNFTDARNTVHHRWIRWAGFTIIKRHTEYGFEKRPFLEFVRITGGPHV